MAGEFTKADDAETGGDFLGQADTDTDKHLLIRVPNFGTSTFQTRGDIDHADGNTEQVSMTSFLRLGKFDAKDETPRSNELLAAIHRAGGPGNPSRPKSQQWPADAKWTAADGTWLEKAPPFTDRDQAKAALAGNNDVFFLDDVRIHDVDLDQTILTKDDTTVRGHGLTMRQRQSESRQLFARGGWRDHSDGNRVTTTYGDKVEVVRGNYKMIVMGRQDDPGEAMGWEATGDHVVDYAPGTMPGAGFWLEFVPDYTFKTVGEAKPEDNKNETGVWLLVNTTEGVYEYARYAGNFREERWGDVLETYIGSANPPGTSVAVDGSKGTKGHNPPARLEGRKYDLPKYGPASPPGDDAGRMVPEWEHDNQDVIRSNPHIIEKTWAERIDSHRGSNDCPVPAIYEETHAKTMNGLVQATTSIENVTYAPKITEFLGIKKAHYDDHAGGREYDPAYWAEKISTVNCAQLFDEEIHAHAITLTKWGTAWEMWMGAFGEMFVGPRMNLTAALSLDVFLGAKFTLQAAVGYELSTQGVGELVLPRSDKITIEDVVACMNQRHVALKKEIAALKVETNALSWNCSCLNVCLGI